SYDSSKEDAQNPFPELDDTPPGKRAFQKGKAGKQPLRADSAQTVVVETPPPKLKRAGTDELSGSLPKKVRDALRRPQSIDQQTASERKARAKKTQKQLEQDFEEATDPKDQSTAEVDEHKEESEAPPKKEAKKRKAEDDESKAPTKPVKGKQATADSKVSGNKATTEDHRTARSSNEALPSPKKSARKPPTIASPSKDKQADEKESNKENTLEDKKKFAHKMYMRFYRSVHSRTCPAEIKSAFHQSKYCKNKMSSLYEDYLQTEGDWKKSMVYKTIKSITRNGRRGIRRWLTRSQMLVHFDDATIVDSIIARKETDEYLKKKRCESTPTAQEPGGLVQYLVLVDEEVTDEDVDEITDMFRQEDGDDSSGSNDDDDDTPDSKGGKDREVVCECLMNESVGG
ncbi:unnamed protein product, partial [Symbiodinium sp. CCMP2592]